MQTGLESLSNRVRLQEDQASIDAEAIKSDTQDALDLLQDLQSQYEAVNMIDAIPILSVKASID